MHVYLLGQGMQLSVFAWSEHARVYFHGQSMLRARCPKGSTGLKVVRNHLLELDVFAWPRRIQEDTGKPLKRITMDRGD